MVIVDNAIHSFGYQLLNGIPIIPFLDNKQDKVRLNLPGTATPCRIPRKPTFMR